ncbi:MAG TPA: ABC transporter permease [Jatrophihabitans sp.]
MLDFITFVIIGITTGAIYSIAATGLVLTYTTSRIFNLAHGAIGMIQVFIYWQLLEGWGLPEWVALPLVVLVIGPAIGVLLNVTVMQKLARTPIALRLTGTLAIFVLLEGLAVLIWKSDLRTIPGLISDDTFQIASVRITWNQLTTVIIALAVAIALRLFMHGTRIGVAMRAIVDDPALAELTAVNPTRITNVSWAIGSSLAGLASILIAPALSLDISSLSLMIVSAFAAAIIGGLASIPWTYVGGLALGIAGSLMTLYLPVNNEFLQGLAPSLPFIILFGALIVMRQERQTLTAKLSNVAVEAVPKVKTILTWSAILILVVGLFAPHMSTFVSAVFGTGLVFSAILVSLTLLTGLGGQVSLCQFAFVGIGAISLVHFQHHMPYLLAALLATLLTAAVGAVIALPAIRLRGLYVALATFAFAIMCDKLVFASTHLMGAAGEAITAPDIDIFGFKITTSRAYVFAGAVLVALFAAGVQFARRGRFGRTLAAMRDSPAAAAALGLRLTRTKVLVFALSAGMAGLAGCFFASMQGQVGASQFNFMWSLIALLILAVQGVTSVPGAVIGGAMYAIIYMMLPQWITNAHIVSALQPMLIGMAVFSVLRNPEGAWPVQMRGFMKLIQGRRKPPSAPPPDVSEPAVKDVAMAGGH